jgi:RTX calcium-binding nonapeptide repeat (4 copies)
LLIHPQSNSIMPVNLVPIQVQASVQSTAKTNVKGRSLGIGLGGIADFSTELPFVNIFQSSRAWIPQSAGSWDTGKALDLDSSGWVKSLPQDSFAGTLMMRDMPNVYRTGRYIVSYEGTGTLEYGFDAKKVDSESAVGRDVIQVDEAGSGGIYLKITATDPNKTGDYIRNIRVYHEDDLPLVELGVQFNPEFTQKIKDFGTLRFMDWMNTNGSPQKDWSDRPTPNDSSWARKGAPVELMVALANETGTSPWFNMPHQATNDYIAHFAAYVRDHLDPNLKAYVEYSNEVWNWQFPQSHYAVDQAKAKWGESPVGGAGWMQWYGMRSAQTAEIWKSTFGAAQDRVVSVISTQTGWKGLEDPILNTPAWVAEGHAPAYKSVDAYAVTGYFGGNLGSPDNAAIVKSWQTDADGGFGKAFQQLGQGGLLPGADQQSVADTVRSFQYHENIAQHYGLDMVAYEGGQHLVGIGGAENDLGISSFLMELNRRPEMKDLYTTLLNGWKNSGGTLFNHFIDAGAASKWGSWGSLESITQATSPKYSALTSFIAQNNRWWNETNSSARTGSFQRGTSQADQLQSGQYDDILIGGSGNDVMKGGAGNDRLHGEAGNDSLMGNTGDDRLIGGFGSDILIGGAGADRFIYPDLKTSLVGAPDRIRDFNISQGDRIQLSPLATLPSLTNAGQRTGKTLSGVAIAAGASLNAEAALLFSWGSKTYLVVNDKAPGFAPAQDLIVELGGTPMPTGILQASNYFA